MISVWWEAIPTIIQILNSVRRSNHYSLRPETHRSSVWLLSKSPVVTACPTVNDSRNRFHRIFVVSTRFLRAIFRSAFAGGHMVCVCGAREPEAAACDFSARLIGHSARSQPHAERSRPHAALASGLRPLPSAVGPGTRARVNPCAMSHSNGGRSSGGRRRRPVSTAPRAAAC